MPNFAVRYLVAQAGDDADNPIRAGAAMQSYQISPRSKQANPHPLPLAWFQPELPLTLLDLRDIGTLQDHHRQPLVSLGKIGDQWQRMERRWAPEAWRDWPEVEISPPWARAVIVLDVDTSTQDWLNVAQGPNVKPPNWIASRPANQHAHIAYTLRNPVLRGPDCSIRALSILGRVSEHLRQAYGADTGYHGPTAHNPLHDNWETSWLRLEPYTLGELAECIPKGWRIPKQPTTAEGRNSTLFRAAMRWFGRPSNWEASTDLGDVLAWCEAYNATWFPVPLPDLEVKHIAKHVVGYCRRNLASGKTQYGLSQSQSWKGRRGGKMSGASRRKGTPLMTDRTPWETDGISRRTWYRRRAAHSSGTEA